MALLFHLGAPPSTTNNETRAAAVLFERFETVFHTSPALLSAPSADGSVDFMGEPFAYLLLGLDKAGVQARKSVLADASAVLLGTKDYLPPNGLGRTVSTRCYAVVLRQGNSIEISRYVDKSTLLSTTGPQIWKWSASLGEFGERDPRPSSVYATQIGHTFILVSNNLEELKNASEQLTALHNGPAVTGIREWDDVSHHEFWGYRKYRHDQPPAASTTFAGTKGIKPDAEALILYVDHKRNSGILRLLGSKVDDGTAKSLTAEMTMPPLKPVGPGVWANIFPLADAGPYSETPFQIMWLFGLGVAV